MDNKSKFYMGGLLAGLLSLPGALWADCSIVTNPDTNAISAYSLSGQGNFACRDLGMDDVSASVMANGTTLDWSIGSATQVDAVAVEDSSGKRCVYNYAPGETEGFGLAPPSDKVISEYLVCADDADLPAPNTAPVVMISLPANDGLEFAGGEVIHFQGDAQDKEDDELTDDLQWSSSLDGPLQGSGGDVYVDDLSAGLHVITAQVGDSEGLIGSDTVSVVVAPTVAQNCEIVVDENSTTSVLINGVSVGCPTETDDDGNLLPRLVCSADLSDDADKFELGSTACCLCNATAVECDAGLAEGETGELIACPDSNGTKGALQVPSTLMFNNDPYYCYTIGGKRTCFAY